MPNMMFTKPQTQAKIHAEQDRLYERLIETLGHADEYAHVNIAGLQEQLLGHNFAQGEFDLNKLKSPFKKAPLGLSDQELDGQNIPETDSLRQQKQAAVLQYQELKRRVEELNKKRLLFNSRLLEAEFERSQEQQRLAQAALANSGEELSVDDLEQLNHKTKHLQFSDETTFEKFNTLKFERKSRNHFSFKVQNGSMPSAGEVKRAVDAIAHAGLKQVTVSGGKAKQREAMAMGVLKRFIHGSGVKLDYQPAQYLEQMKEGSWTQRRLARRELKIDSFLEDLAAAQPPNDLKHSAPGAIMGYMFKKLLPKNKKEFLEKMHNDPECQYHIAGMVDYFIQEQDYQALMELDAQMTSLMVGQGQVKAQSTWGAVFEAQAKASLSKITNVNALQKTVQAIFKARMGSKYSPKSVIAGQHAMGAARAEQYMDAFLAALYQDAQGQFSRERGDLKLGKMAEQYAQDVFTNNDSNSEISLEVGAILMHLKQQQRKVFIDHYARKIEQLGMQQRGIDANQPLKDDWDGAKRNQQFQEIQHNVASAMNQLYRGVGQYANEYALEGSRLGVMQAVDQSCRQSFDRVVNRQWADLNSHHPGLLGGHMPTQEDLQYNQQTCMDRQTDISRFMKDRQHYEGAHEGRAVPAQHAPGAYAPPLSMRV